jgi:hypothetical protein
MMKVPILVSNLKDDVNCTTAVLISMYQYFTDITLSFEISFEMVENIQGFKKGKGCWSFRSLTWLSKNGFQVIHYTNFDYQKLNEIGTDYLYKIFSKKIADYELNESNLLQNLQYVPDYLDRVQTINKVPTLQDIDSLLVQNNLVNATVNYKIFEKNDNSKVSKLNQNMSINAQTLETEAHSVLIYGFDNKGNYLIMDPGLPAMMRVVEKEVMKEAIKLYITDNGQEGDYTSEIIGYIKMT